MASKIGILTFHCAHNYGAVLQTYATQKLLSDAGYDVDVIDYRLTILSSRSGVLILPDSRVRIWFQH